VELLEEKFCRRFDRAVSQKRVGRRRLATGADEPKLFKLNEHGPVLNVFWSRRSGMGAGAGVDDFAARAQAGESKSCTEEKTNEGA
jgi:hypothetical protein